MILKIKFEVESDIVLDDYWAISHDGLRYEFVVGDGGRLEYLVVSVRTNAYPEIYHENGIATMHIPAVVDMCKRRVKDLDISVSAISNVGFAYIKSDEYSIEFVPEDDSEVKKIKIFSFSSSYADQQHGLPVSFDVLARTVFLSSDCAGLDIPLYLYKNSKKHFIAREFRISFYEAYFMIEYLYGNGKTNNRQVCKEFFGSHDLVDAIMKTREDFLFTVREGNLHDLLKEINILGVIEHIVKKRGELFHQSKKRNETWSPVLSENLINEAIFMQILCSYVSLKISGLYCDRYKEMYVESNEKNKVYRSVVVEAKFLCNNEERTIIIKTRVSTAKIGKSTLVTFATDVENMIKEKYGKPIDYRVVMGDRVIFTKSELDEYTRMIDRR